MSNDLQLSESIKLPPQNIESRTIGARFTDVGQRRCSKIADTLRSDDFYKGAHKIIYEAMLELYESARTDRYVEFIKPFRRKKQLEMIGGITYLTTIVNSVPTASHITHYADIVRKKYFKKSHKRFL